MAHNGTRRNNEPAAAVRAPLSQPSVPTACTNTTPSIFSGRMFTAWLNYCAYWWAKFLLSMISLGTYVGDAELPYRQSVENVLLEKKGALRRVSLGGEAFINTVAMHILPLAGIFAGIEIVDPLKLWPGLHVEPWQSVIAMLVCFASPSLYFIYALTTRQFLSLPPAREISRPSD